MISLAHPTLPSLTPPELVRVAAATGFDAVGCRVVGIDAKTAAASIFKDTALLRSTKAVLEGSGIVVLDVEVIAIQPDTRAADFRPLFDAGARLGARYVVAVAMDANEERVTQHYAELCAEAEAFGLGVVLEFMMRGGIRTLEPAYRIVQGSGHRSGGVLIDALHFYRARETPDELARLDPALFPYMQLNDVENFAALSAAPPDSVTWKKVMPGTGDLALAELLAALPDGIPIATEVHGGDGLRGRDAEAWAARALQTTRAVLGAVPVRHT